MIETWLNFPGNLQPWRELSRYSEGMKRVLKTFGPVPEFSGATAEKVHQVCELLPVETRCHLQLGSLP